MSENYKLPGSSYDEIIKIIKAYATSKIGNPLSLEAVAQTAGMDKTIVSRNNGFLIQLGFISEGNKKAPTQVGSDLGRAYNLDMNEQIIDILQTAISNDEFLTRMLSAIRIRNGMEKSSFINHILYSAGSTAKGVRTGAGAIIDMYKAAGLVSEDDGKIIATQADGDRISESAPPDTIKEHAEATIHTIKREALDANLTVNINLNVTVTDIDEISEKIIDLIQALKQDIN